MILMRVEIFADVKRFRFYIKLLSVQLICDISYLELYLFLMKQWNEKKVFTPFSLVFQNETLISVRNLF